MKDVLSREDMWGKAGRRGSAGVNQLKILKFMRLCHLSR